MSIDRNSSLAGGTNPAVWFPAIRAGTGADVFTQRLCDGLNARGMRAEITWLPLRAEYAPWTVPVPQPPPWATIVHVNSWLPERFWRHGLPAVVTVHHLVHDPEFSPYRTLAQAAYHSLLIRSRELSAIRNAAAVTTVSNYVRGTVVKFSGREDISVIYNWADYKKFNPDFSTKSARSGPFKLFMAGSLSRRKGADLLPALVQALGNGFEVRHAGGAEPESDGEGFVELGRISESDLINEYRSCDAVVSLSRYEGFGYTALEAMACGKPFFGFKTSGLAEVVTEDCARLSSIDDIPELVGFCNSIFGSNEQVREMGAKGRLRALTVFSEQSAMDRLRAIYESLLYGRIGP